MFKKRKFYHLIFPTYKRWPSLIDEERTTYINYIVEFFIKNDIDIIVYNILSDHSHWLVVCNNKKSLSEAVKIIKGRSTYYFFREYPELKLEFGKGRLWAKGYHYVLVTNQTQLNTVIDYILDNFDKYRPEQ